RALGYVSGSAAPKPRYTEADDPKRLVELDTDVHRAVEAFGAGRVADAVQIYERVIARRPDYALAYRHLAFIERQRGQMARAIGSRPPSPRSRARRGRTPASAWSPAGAAIDRRRSRRGRAPCSSIPPTSTRSTIWARRWRAPASRTPRVRTCSSSSAPRRRPT